MEFISLNNKSSQELKQLKEVTCVNFNRGHQLIKLEKRRATDTSDFGRMSETRLKDGLEKLVNIRTNKNGKELLQSLNLSSYIFSKMNEIRDEYDNQPIPFRHTIVKRTTKASKSVKLFIEGSQHLFYPSAHQSAVNRATKERVTVMNYHMNGHQLFREYCISVQEGSISNLVCIKSSNTFFKHLPFNYKRASQHTDMCEYCEDGKKLAKMVNRTADEEAYYQFYLDHVRMNNIIREEFRQDKRSDDIVIVVDFKQNIDLNQSLVQLGQQFYQMALRGFLSFVVYVTNQATNEREKYVFSFLTNDLSKTCKLVVQCLNHLLNSAEYQSKVASKSGNVPKTSFKIWCDNAPTFSCYEMISLLEDLAIRMGKDIGVRYFCEKHGKACCDQFFSCVSRAHQDFIKSLTSEVSRDDDAFVAMVGNYCLQGENKWKQHIFRYPWITSDMSVTDATVVPTNHIVPEEDERDDEVESNSDEEEEEEEESDVDPNELVPTRKYSSGTKLFTISTVYRMMIMANGDKFFVTKGDILNNRLDNWIPFTLKTSTKLQKPVQCKIGYEAPTIHNNFTPVAPGSNATVSRVPTWITKRGYSTLVGIAPAVVQAVPAVAQVTPSTNTANDDTEQPFGGVECDYGYDAPQVDVIEPSFEQRMESLAPRILYSASTNFDALKDSISTFASSRRSIAGVSKYTSNGSTSGFILRNEADKGIIVHHFDPTGEHHAVAAMFNKKLVGSVSKSTSNVAVSRSEDVTMTMLDRAVTFLTQNKEIGRRAFPTAMNTISSTLDQEDGPTSKLQAG